MNESYQKEPKGKSIWAYVIAFSIVIAVIAFLVFVFIVGGLLTGYLFELGHALLQFLVQNTPSNHDTCN